MAMSKIVVNTSQLARISKMLKALGNKRQLQQAVARSIRRTLPTIRKTAFSEIRGKRLLNLKTKTLKNKVRLYQVAGAGKAVDEQYGRIWMTPAPESLAHFFAKRVKAPSGSSKRMWDKKLYAVRVNSAGAASLTHPERTFMVDRGSGSVILQRVGTRRLPLVKLFGPSVAELSQTTGFVKTMESVARKKFDQQMDQNLKYFVDKAMKKS